MKREDRPPCYIVLQLLVLRNTWAKSFLTMPDRFLELASKSKHYNHLWKTLAGPGYQSALCRLTVGLRFPRTQTDGLVRARNKKRQARERRLGFRDSGNGQNPSRAACVAQALKLAGSRLIATPSRGGKGSRAPGSKKQLLAPVGPQRRRLGIYSRDIERRMSERD